MRQLQILGDRWSVVGASVPGESHRRAGTGGQDWFDARVELAGVVAVVGDGLGSRPHSDIGSRVATETFTDVVAAALANAPRTEAGWATLFTRALASCVDELERHADAAGCPLADLSTTLLAAVVTDNVTATYQIGDGAIVLVVDDRPVRVPGGAGGEFVNITETIFSHSNPAMSLRWRSDVREVALITDGLERISIDLATGYPSERFFRPFWNNTPTPGADDELTDWLVSPLVAQRADDDLTLVTAVRHR